MKEMFQLFDRNKDKSISVDEMGKALRAMGFNRTHKELKTAMKKIDTNSKWHLLSHIYPTKKKHNKSQKDH